MEDLEKVQKAMDRLIEEVREFREVADSLPSRGSESVAEKIEDYLRGGD